MKKNLIAAMASVLFVAGVSTTAQGATQVPSEVERWSHVETVVTDLGNGFYHYAYTVWNDSPAPQFIEEDFRMGVWPRIVGWEIPLDSPGVVSQLTAPETWAWRFLSADEYLALYGVENPFDSLYVLQWYDYELFEEISPDKSIVPLGFNDFFSDDEYEPYANGFSFVSALQPVDGPYAAIWEDTYRQIGDPPLPGGVIGGGGLPYTPRHQMPDGGITAVLLGLSLIGLQICRRSR